MDILVKFFGGAFALIGLYLVLRNYQGANKVLEGFATGSSNVFATLQGR